MESLNVLEDPLEVVVETPVLFNARVRITIVLICVCQRLMRCDFICAKCFFYEVDAMRFHLCKHCFLHGRDEKPVRLQTADGIDSYEGGESVFLRFGPEEVTLTLIFLVTQAEQERSSIGQITARHEVRSI